MPPKHHLSKWQMFVKKHAGMGMTTKKLAKAYHSNMPIVVKHKVKRRRVHGKGLSGGTGTFG